MPTLDVINRGLEKLRDKLYNSDSMPWIWVAYSEIAETKMEILFFYKRWNMHFRTFMFLLHFKHQYF